jgi:hypothetical protein
MLSINYYINIFNKDFCFCVLNFVLFPFYFYFCWLVVCSMGGQSRNWTPHKRRGPIAAEFSGPGPAAIALPSLFGSKCFLLSLAVFLPPWNVFKQSIVLLSHVFQPSLIAHTFGRFRKRHMVPSSPLNCILRSGLHYSPYFNVLQLLYCPLFCTSKTIVC